MQLIPLSEVVIAKRQRRSINSAQLLELKTSILERSLLHPPVVWRGDDGKYQLVVGERRFRAIELLAKELRTFRYGNIEVPPGQIAVNLLGDYLSEEGRFAAELEENTHRVDLTWAERCEALAVLHEMRKAANPQQTLQATGTEVAAKTGSNAEWSAQLVKQAVVVAANLSNPKIANARNATEAYNLILKQEEDRINAAIARRQLATMSTGPEVELKNGDLFDLLPRLEEGIADLILADPPYGIEASGGGFRSRTVVHHNYSDTPEDARRVAQCILTEGFRVGKPRCNLLLFTDIKHWEWLQRASANMGWEPFRRPLIWGKSESEGLAPWGARGPRITTEFIFFATKGGRGLASSPIDYISEKRVPRHEREHAAEKPVALLKYLIETATLPGDFVLDPCVGSGSTLVACKESNRRGLGIEKDSDYFELAMARVHGRESNA